MQNISNLNHTGDQTLGTQG